MAGASNYINLDLRLYLTKISNSVAILKIRFKKSVIYCTHIYKYKGYGDSAQALCILWNISIHISQISQKTPVVPQESCIVCTVEWQQKRPILLLILHFDRSLCWLLKLLYYLLYGEEEVTYIRPKRTFYPEFQLAMPTLNY